MSRFETHANIALERDTIALFLSFTPILEQKTAVAVAHVKQGKGLRLNGSPIELEKTDYSELKL